MDNDPLTLLPSVCRVLADSQLSLHDDTCLEKLLDCFKDLITRNGEQYFAQFMPCLLKFLQTITKSQAVDPSVFSFSLKLAGLLASTEHSFTLLQPKSWQIPELWENSSVRYGWLHGLWNMLQHSQSLNFFCKNGFIKLVLELQNDKGFFISSLTGQILTHVFKLIKSNFGPLNADFVLVEKEVMTHITSSLTSEEKAVIVPALRLLATVLTQCREPLHEMIWKRVVGPLEVLANLKDVSFTLPIMSVLHAVARSPVLMQSDECPRVETLMDIMLFSKSAAESVQCAANILQMENCPENLKRKATDVILLPLLCVTASSLQLQDPDKLKSYTQQLEEQLSRKALCVCLLAQSLSSTAEHVHQISLADIPVQLIVSSVIKLVEMCDGRASEAGAFPHLIGCSKVQQCSIDLLSALTVYAESSLLVLKVLPVLLRYLQCPDSHATVLKKSYQATLKYLTLCAPSSDLWKTTVVELLQLMKKRVCDARWEVRDSTLEFFTQLTAKFKDDEKYTEILQSSDTISEIFTSLSDSESYVQASAVTALGEAVTSPGVCADVQEKAVTHLLRILSQETQSFPRRAALQVCITWLKSSHSCTALEQSISSVLLLAGHDFDWEVKVHTLELADALMDQSLGPDRLQKIPEHDESSYVTHALAKFKDFGALDFLFKCAFDCDRPVSQKACSLMLKLRTLTREKVNADCTVPTVDLDWNEETFRRSCKRRDTVSPIADPHDGAPKIMDLCQLLEMLDLENMEHLSSLSSDHVISSPQSLMEDILFMSRGSEDNIADCY